MMKKSLVFFAIIFIIPFYNVKGQHTGDDKVGYNLVQVPPSPDASSLGKYTENPVSLNTGVPQISIPLLNLELGTINLPVILNYHASGNKVEEEASWVGLGWSLNVGGSISRTIRARPDEHGGFLFTGNQIPVENYIELDLVTQGRIANSINFLSEVVKNNKDYEPDAFYYNYPSGNGSFMFNNHAKPTTVPYSDVKIEFSKTAGDITAFTLTDGNGLIYYYGDTIEKSQNPYVEITHTNNGAFGTIEAYISTWHLNKIINPLTAEVVRFYYSSGNMRTFSRTESEIWEQERWFDSRFFLKNHDEYLTLITTSVKYLRKMVYDNDSIELYTSSRQDNWGRKLDSIKYNNEVIRYFYDYYNPLGDSNEKRLKLESLVLGDGSKNKSYKFRYDPTKLPVKDSKDIDHWGYYNENPLETLIPTTYYGTQIFPGANREPKYEKAIAGILNEITYPTGGSSEFFYELNSALRPPTIQEVSFPVNVNFEITDSTSIGPLIIQELFDINIDDPNLYNLKLTGSIVDNSQSGILPPHYSANAAIIDSFNNVLYSQSITWGDSCCFSLDVDTTILNNCKLRLTLNRCDSLTFYTSIEYVTYDSSMLIIPVEAKGGGLRIKKIVNHDNGVDNIKSFDYCNSGYFTRIAGQYYSPTASYIIDYTGNLIKLNGICKYTAPVGGLGSSSNSIAYTKVIEYNGTPEKNMGYKVNYYRKILDDVSAGSYDPQMSLQYLRESVIKEELVESNNKLVKAVNYEYTNDPQHNEVIEGFKASKNYDIGPEIMVANLYAEMYSFYRFNFTLPKELLKKTNTKYFFNNDSMQESTEYEYSFKHLNPIKIITINSKDQIVKKEFKYPADYIELDYNSCTDNYIKDLAECASIFPSCFDEVVNCNSIYGDCYSQRMDQIEELAKLMKKQTDSLETLRIENKIDGRNVMYREIARIRRKYYNDPDHKVFNVAKCLKDNGFSQCIDNLYCGYIPCALIADENYCSCQDSLDVEFANLYESADNELKAIYALYMYECKNKPIEEKTYVDGVLTEHIKKVYSLYPLIDMFQMPILDKVIKIYDNSNAEDILVKCDSTNQFSNIRQTDQNSLKSAYQYGYNNKYLISKTINSTVNEAGYTGFENKELNDWTKYPNNLFDDHEFFTGASSISVVDSSCGPTKDFNVGMQAANHNGYQASVWVKGSKNAYLHIEANGWSIHERTRNDEGSDDWHLLKVILYRHQYESVIDSTLKIRVYVGVEGEELAHFDDLRFYPLDAQMTTYTYIPLIGTSSISDNNNKPTKYEYDSFGRLTHIRDFQDNILKKYDYHFKP